MAPMTPSPTASAYSKLSPELWAEIFWHAIDDTHPPPARNQSPVSPSLVCRYWRDVVYSTPRLWSMLEVRLKEEEEEFPSADVMKWARAAGRVPLALTLRLGCLPPDISAFLAELEKERRLGSLVVVVPTTEVQNALDQIQVSTTLRDLEIRGTKPVNWDSAPGTRLRGAQLDPTLEEEHSLVVPGQTFSNSNLSSFTISVEQHRRHRPYFQFHFEDANAHLVSAEETQTGHDVHDTPTPTSIVQPTPTSYPHLRQLTIEALIQTHEFLRAVAHFPNLEELKVTKLTWLRKDYLPGPFAIPRAENRDRDPPPILLGDLTSLYLGAVRDVWPILARLQLPKLEILRLRMSVWTFMGRDYDSRESLIQLLTDSRPPLRTLDLVETPLDQGMFVRCLECVPKLKHLVVDNSVIGLGVLEKLELTTKNSDLVPELEEMTMYRMYKDWAVGAIADVTASRYEKLKVVRLVAGDENFEELLKQHPNCDCSSRRGLRIVKCQDLDI